MKKLILTWAMMCMCIMTIAQTGSVTGVIFTEKDLPAQYVSIGIKNTSLGAITDVNGKFQIKNISSGQQLLVITSLGYTTLEKQIEIKTDRETDLGKIVLEVSSDELTPLSLSIDSKGKSSNYVAKLPLKNIENPQVYTTISSDLMQEQVITNIDDALKNATGLEKLWESTGRAGDGAGYYSLRGFSVQPTLVNGLPGLTNGSLDPANIESIEVIRGPSGALFGSSLISYGGLINTVTKKPYDGFGGKMNYTSGSFGLNRVAADLNTPLDSSNKVILRTNAAYHTEQSFQDAGFRKSVFIAPSLKYKASEKLTFDITTEFLETEGTNQTMLFLSRSQPLAYANLDELNYDNYKSYTSNNLSIKNPRSNIQALATYKFAKNWTAQTAVSRGAAHTDGYYTYLYDFADGSTFGRYLQKQNSTTYTTDIQENIVGDLKVGKIRNRILIGLDYYQRNVVSNHTGWVGFGAVVNGEDNEDLTQSAADSALSGSSFTKSTSQEKIYSTYIADVVNLNQKLSFMASLRLDGFNSFGEVGDETDDYSQTALSPKFGAVYQIKKDVFAVFANYMNGFSNVSPTTVADINGNNPTLKSFDPEHANQAEFGFKSSILNNLFDVTLNYYDILVSNKVMSDPTNPNNTIQGGEVKSKGVEFSVVGEPIKNLKVFGGYSYNDNKVLKADDSNIFSLQGKRSSEAGPSNLYNGWITYTFGLQPIEGLGVGFGVNGASERVILDSDVTGKFTVPAYTIFNASVYYEKYDYRISLKLDNLTDQEYYKGWSTINPQRPRTYAINFLYRF